MKKFFLLGSVCALLAGCFSDGVKSGKSLSVIKDGKAEAVIVIPEKAPHMTKFAAKELSSYLKKISGAELPVQTQASKNKINIYVGRDKDGAISKELAKLPPDSYKVIATDKSIVLYGRDYNGPPLSAPCHPFRLAQTYNKKLNLSKYGEAGTLFAVYDFLRQQGVRWYMPGELGEVVPDKKNIAVKFQDKTVSPDYSYRFLYFNDAGYDPEGMLWFRRLGLGAPKPIFFNHTMQKLQKKLRKTHPEYFAIVDGERDLTNTCMGQGSLKLTNPKVVKAMADFARENLDKNKDLYIFPICLPDGYKRPDDSDVDKIDWNKKESASLSEYVWDFMNKTALEVYKTHPDRKIGNIAYQRWQAPPENIEKLAPNMEVMVCRSGDNCTGRSAYYDPENKQKMRRYFDGWTKKTDKIYAWDYYLFWHKNSDLTGAPIFFTKIIDDDLKFLKGKIQGEFIEGSKVYKGKRYCLAAPGMQHLNLYVTARLYWDADQNLEALIDDYCHKFYGPAADEMKQFFKDAESIWMRAQKRKPYIELYTMKDLERLDGILEKALKAAGISPNKKYSDRIKLIKNELEFFISTSRLKLNKLPEMKASKAGDDFVDGMAKEVFWSKAPVAFLNQMKSGRASKIKTEIKIANDNKNLYLFAKCFEPEMKKIKTGERGRDGFIWKDETLEFFIMPKNRKEYFQISVNPSASIWDGRWQLEPVKTKKGFKAAKWNAGIKVKTTKQNDCWTVEMVIPLKDVLPDDSKFFFMNIMRSRAAGPSQEYFAWSPTFKARIHDSSRFGKVYLSK